MRSTATCTLSQHVALPIFAGTSPCSSYDAASSSSTVYGSGVVVGAGIERASYRPRVRQPSRLGSLPMAPPTPPNAPRRPHVLSIHGDDRVDDWYWLRDRDDPEVRAHLEA